MEARGRRGGGVKAEEKRPALSALTRGDGEETTLLTGGVGGDHLSVRGEWWKWVGSFPACDGLGLVWLGRFWSSWAVSLFFFVLFLFLFLFSVLFIVFDCFNSKSFSKFL